MRADRPPPATPAQVRTLDTPGMDDERPPICPICGVTMVPAALSARDASGDWICVECEETDDGGD